jgi:thymidylate kinase
MRSSRVEGHVDANQGHPKTAAAGIKKYGLAKILYALRSVSLAYERRALLLRARRSAANGRIIICDRYPSAENGAMDSPRLEQENSQHSLAAQLYNGLAQLETRIYNGIPAPDIVLRLSVSIETAKQRNRERIKLDKESDAYLESRHRQCKTWHRPGAMRIYDISTEHSIADTVRSVRQAIWESL